MKPKYYLLLIVLLSTLISGCSSGKRALQYGDYYNATMTSINRLRAQPDNKKSQSVLLQAYPLAKQTELRNIENLLGSNEANKYALLVDKLFGIESIS